MTDKKFLVKPVITEKAFDKVNKGWYTFLVGRGLRKNQAAKVIEEIFKVNVVKVKSVILKGKSRRSAKTRKLIKLPTYKKVTVRLAPEQKIDLFETGGKP